MTRRPLRRAVVVSAVVGLLACAAAAVVGFELVATSLHRGVDAVARRGAARTGWGCVVVALLLGGLHGLRRSPSSALVAAAWVALAEGVGATAAGVAVQVVCGGPSGCSTEGDQVALLPMVGTGLALALPAAVVGWVVVTTLVSRDHGRPETPGVAPTGRWRRPAPWPRRLVVGCCGWVVLLLAWQVALAAELSRVLDPSRPSIAWVRDLTVVAGVGVASSVATVAWGAALGRARAWHQLSSCTLLGVLVLCAQPAAAAVLASVATSDLTTLDLQLLPLAAVPLFAAASTLSVALLLALGAVPAALGAGRREPVAG